jgi:AcrR family transcriptional regulator
MGMTVGSRVSVMKAAPKVTGRPPSLTLTDVLDAAIDMGLGGVSMRELAARLGVATATIYNYVESRDDLVSLAARRQVERFRFDDVGGDWRDLIRGHVRRFFNLCSAEPQLVMQHMQGLVAPDVNLDYLDSLLAALVKRGFTVSEAYRLYSSANFVVLGAIVRAAHVGALKELGQSHGRTVKRSMAVRTSDELSFLRACEDYADDARAFAWEETIERVIDSFARDRGPVDRRATQEPRADRKPKKNAPKS